MIIQQPDDYIWENSAYIDQANPVQNTWYEVLNTVYYGHIKQINFQVTPVAEDLECRITIGTKTETITVGSTSSVVRIFISQSTVNDYWFVSATTSLTQVYMIEGQGLTVEIRKTSANGNSNITAAVKYQRLINR